MPVYSYDDRAEASKILSEKGDTKGTNPEFDGIDFDGSGARASRQASSKGSTQETRKIAGAKKGDTKGTNPEFDGIDFDGSGAQAAKDKAQQQKAIDEAKKKKSLDAKAKGRAGATMPGGVNPSKVVPTSSAGRSLFLQRSVMQPYRNNDGSYDLKRAIESRLIGAGTMRNAGFTDSQITAAINAAMRDQEAAQETRKIAGAKKGDTKGTNPEFDGIDFDGSGARASRQASSKGSTGSQKGTAQSLEDQINPGETIGKWEVKTENGTKTFFAVSEEQARREAERFGLHPTDAKLVDLKTYTEAELNRIKAKMGSIDARASRRAEFEQAIKIGLIPEDAEFVLMGDRDWGYRVGPVTMSEEDRLKADRSYDSAKGMLAKYTSRVPWRHTVITRFDFVKFVEDLGPKEALKVLTDAGYTLKDATSILKQAKVEGEALQKVQPYTDKWGRIDIIEALRNDVPYKTLRDLGFDSETIFEAQYYANTIARATPTPKAPAKPITDIMMHVPTQQPSASNLWRFLALTKMEEYKVKGEDDLYDLKAAHEDGIKPEVMAWAGFNTDDIEKALNAKRPEDKCTCSPKSSSKIDTVDKRVLQDEIMVHIPKNFPDEGVLMPALAKAQDWLRDETKGKNKVLRVGAGLAVGVSFALAPIAMLDDLFVTDGWQQKGQKVKGYAEGTVKYFLTLPVAFMNDPYFTSGEVAGLVAGPKGALKAARSARVWVDPYGAPARSVGIEFSTGKASIKGIDTAKLGEAITQAQREILAGKLEGTVTVGDVTIKYRGTPIQHTVGDVVFHADTNVQRFTTKDVIKVPEGQGMYFSPYVSPRFMAESAAGATASKPGVVAVLTDASNIRTAPRATLKNVKQGEGFILQASEGLYGPSKIYRNRFETEVVAAPGTTFTKAPGNLRTRILGEKAGEFFVQYDGPTVAGLSSGALVPVTVLLDKGVFRKPPSPSALYAAKLLTIYESLKDFGVKVRNPTKALKDIAVSKKGEPLRDHMALTKEIEAEARSKTKDVAKRDKVSEETAYRKALTEAYEKRAQEVYRSVGQSAELRYLKDRAVFEQAYRARLEEYLRVAARTMTLGRARETVAEASRRTPVSRKIEDLPKSVRELRRNTREERGEVPLGYYYNFEEEGTPPPPPPPPSTPPPPPRLVTSSTTKRPPPKKEGLLTKRAQRQFPVGDVGWRQGKFWIRGRPPWQDKPRKVAAVGAVVYSLRPLPGAKVLKGTPEETFFTRGSRLPKKFRVSMGDALVTVRPDRKPHLIFGPSKTAKRRQSKKRRRR